MNEAFEGWSVRWSFSLDFCCNLGREIVLKDGCRDLSNSMEFFSSGYRRVEFRDRKQNGVGVEFHHHHLKFVLRSGC